MSLNELYVLSIVKTENKSFHAQENGLRLPRQIYRPQQNSYRA